MKKRTIILISITAACFLVYAIYVYARDGMEFSNIPVISHDFSDVRYSTVFAQEDSIQLSAHFRKQCSVRITVEYSDSSHYSLVNLPNNYQLCIRELPSKAIDLRTLKPKFESTSAELNTVYDVQGMAMYKKLIALLSRKPNYSELIIDGKRLQILKHTKDTLWIHGKILNLSLGGKGTVNEIWLQRNQGPFRRTVEAEFMLLNRNGQLYEYFLAPNSSGISVPVKILSRVK